MFNLLMFNVDWVSGKVSIPTVRIFEYTENHIAEQFRKNGILQLDRLTTLPAYSVRKVRRMKLLIVVRSIEHEL